MALVGIIANPAASKDIRRLVAQGRVVPDWEKVNIVRRALLGLQSVGVGPGPGNAPTVLTSCGALPMILICPSK